MVKNEGSLARLEQLRQWLIEQNPKISKAAIERKCGVATNYFNTRTKAGISDGEKNLRPQTIKKVIAAWAEQEPKTPSLNVDWLTTGEGEMFLDKEETVINESNGTPYYDVDFLGGFDLLCNDQTTIPAYYIDFQPYNKKGNPVKNSFQSRSVLSGSGGSEFIYSDTTTYKYKNVKVPKKYWHLYDN